LATAAGLVAGALAVVGLAAADWPQHTRPRYVIAAPAHPAEDFVAQWRRMRLGTWVVEARFARVTAAGRRLESDVHMAQRPPDRLVAGLGAVDARRGDVRLACATGPDDVLRCRDGARAQPYDEEVEAEVAILRTYVLGSGAFYAVRAEGACFVLSLSRQILSPPYGRRATFCFDPVSAAPVRTEVVRQEATDRTVAISGRAEPTDADLDPEKWNGGGRG
jgi:hypothetical protein